MASVLITGAGTGIGKAIAEKFLGEGFDVIAVGRRPDPLRELERANAANVRAIQCDVSKADDVNRLGAFLKTDPTFGANLTVLVNNAGSYEPRAFTETNDKEWEATFATNLMGPVRVTREVLPLLAKNRGVIINVSSTLGLSPVVRTSVYSASKAAMNNWTQTLALELGPQGIRVNAVCPGIVDTPIHSFFGKPEEHAKLASLQPLGRIGRPDDVAHAVWSLAGPGSEWITGALLPVDGGISLV